MIRQIHFFALQPPVPRHLHAEPDGPLRELHPVSLLQAVLRPQDGDPTQERADDLKDG